MRGSGKMTLLHKLLPKLRAEVRAGQGVGGPRHLAAWGLTTKPRPGGAGLDAHSRGLECVGQAEWNVLLGCFGTGNRGLCSTAAKFHGRSWLPPSCTIPPPPFPPCLPPSAPQGKRVLIFSQFVMMLNVLEDYCTLMGYPVERIDGSIKGRERQQAIDRFSAAGACMHCVCVCASASVCLRGGVEGECVAKGECVCYRYKEQQNEARPDVCVCACCCKAALALGGRA